MSTPPPTRRRASENRLTPSAGLCEHCRGPLPDRPGRGEPRRFCSTRCRRLGWLDRQRAEAVASREAGYREVLERVVTGLAAIIGGLRA